MSEEVPQRELVGSKNICYICCDWPPIYEAPNVKAKLIPIYDRKRIMYVHMSCAVSAIMEDMRLRNLKEAWKNVFE